MAKVLVTYGDKDQHSVEFELRDGDVWGRYPHFAWELRPVLDSDPVQALTVRTLYTLLSLYGGDWNPGEPKTHQTLETEEPGSRRYES